MKDKTIKRLIAIILVMLFLVGSVNVLAIDETRTLSGKIDEDLRVKLKTISEDERIPVCIWRKPIDHTEITEMLMTEKGYNAEEYEDPTSFLNDVYPLIAKEVEFKLGYSQAHTSVPIMEGSEILQEITPVESAVRDRMNDYIAAKRELYKREYVLSNRAFLNNVLPNLPQKDRIYSGKYSSTIIANLTKIEIKSVIKDDSVESISMFQNSTVEPTLATALSLVGVYCEGGTGYSQLFNGNGISIGIIEAKNGRFDSTVPQLANNPNLHYVYNIREDNTPVLPVPNSHATHVTTIVVGKEVIQNGIVYPAGVVPAATVYQTSASTVGEVYSGINVLIDNGAKIINCSLGLETGSTYSFFDKEIDRIIIDKSIILVVSAGNKGTEDNQGNIKSPGKALNAITVGNVDTTGDSLPFQMYDGYFNQLYQIPNYGRSCYYEDSYLPNKPDISAPGTGLIFGAATDTGTGTSYSAPIVTGILAQMLQANYSLYANPLVAKAKLLLAANKEAIYTSASYNHAVGNYLFDKSGAGGVDSIATVNCAFSPYYYSNGYSQDQTLPSFYCLAGQKLRAVLIFNRRNISDISSDTDLDDIDFYLRQGESSINCAWSLSLRNNVEIIEYTIPNNGYYSFFVQGYRIVNPTYSPQVAITYTLS